MTNRNLKILMISVSFLAFSQTALSGEKVTRPVPNYSGTTYKARVPDTLDLAARCSLAAQCVTSVVEPNKDYFMYFNATFGRQPAFLSTYEGMGNTVKFMEALPFLRVASGNLINPQCEQSWVNTLLEQKNISGRLLGAAGLYYKLTGDEYFKLVGTQMVNQLVGSLKYENDYAYLPRTQKKPGSDIITDPNADYHTFMWIVDGLVRFYRMTDFKPALDIAGKLVKAEMRDNCYYYHNHQDGSFADEPIMWYGVSNKQHFHCNTLMRLSCLEYALAANDKSVMEWVLKGYEYGKEHGEPITGWFPEALSGQVNAVYNISEMCAVGDMTQLALRLAQGGYDYCWDDADRWIRNALAEGQLTDVSWLKNYYNSPFCKAATAYDMQQMPKGKTMEDVIKEKHPDANFDNAAQRSVGGFGGWVAYNDWFGGYNLNDGFAIMHCCTGNCARAIYAAYDTIISYDEKANFLKVNLLLNRASKYADIDSFIPYRGKVEIKTKQPLYLSVRIPGWVNLAEVTVNVGKKEIKDLTFDGRYALIGVVKADQIVSVNFPIKEETKTVRLRYYEPVFYIGEYYTLTLRGSTVVDIFPKGKFCPLYQREKYKHEKVRYINVNRFVCDKELPW